MKIYSAMKSNVVYYGLKPFHTEYGYLDSEYYYIHMFSQGSNQNLNRFLALLPPKNSNYYPLSDFYKEFTDFNLTQKDCVNFHGFENEEYKYDVETNNISFLHILHSNEDKTYYNFHFLRVFKYAKEHEIGQSFEDKFYTYLVENNTDVFTTDARYLNGKKEKILYILDKEKIFRFLDKKIQNPGTYGAYHCISECFYSILLNTNSRFLDIFSIWYNISKNSISSNHPLTRYKSLEHFDKRGIRLFYCRHGLGKMDAKFMLTPKTEVVLYIQNKKILTTKIVFFCKD